MATHAIQHPAIRSRRLAAVLNAGAAIWRSIMWIVLAVVVAVDIVLFGLGLDQDGYPFPAMVFMVCALLVEAGVVAWHFARLGDIQHARKEAQQ